jgi:hypothetical protein
MTKRINIKHKLKNDIAVLLLYFTNVYTISYT